jgi:hypothetical protein
MVRSKWLPANKACTPFRNNLSQSRTHVAIITTNYRLAVVLSKIIPALQHPIATPVAMMRPSSWVHPRQTCFVPGWRRTSAAFTWSSKRPSRMPWLIGLSPVQLRASDNMQGEIYAYICSMAAPLEL